MLVTSSIAPAVADPDGGVWRDKDPLAAGADASYGYRRSSVLGSPVTAASPSTDRGV